MPHRAREAPVGTGRLPPSDTTVPLLLVALNTKLPAPRAHRGARNRFCASAGLPSASAGRAGEAQMAAPITASTRYSVVLTSMTREASMKDVLAQLLLPAVAGGARMVR